jgi:hypothetical protein
VAVTRSRVQKLPRPVRSALRLRRFAIKGSMEGTPQATEHWTAIISIVPEFGARCREAPQKPANTSDLCHPIAAPISWLGCQSAGTYSYAKPLDVFFNILDNKFRLAAKDIQSLLAPVSDLAAVGADSGIRSGVLGQEGNAI